MVYRSIELLCLYIYIVELNKLAIAIFNGYLKICNVYSANHYLPWYTNTCLNKLTSVLRIEHICHKKNINQLQPLKHNFLFHQVHSLSEMRSLPDTSTHGQKWESIHSHFDLVQIFQYPLLVMCRS